MTQPALQTHQTAPINRDHTGDHHVNYLKIFFALCVCTLLSVALDLIHLPAVLLIALVMAVAVAKALLVMAYFMHLKFERGWKYVVLAPTAILAMGLVIGLIPDIAMHYYKMDFPQQQWLNEGIKSESSH